MLLCLLLVQLVLSSRSGSQLSLPPAQLFTRVSQQQQEVTLTWRASGHCLKCVCVLTGVQHVRRLGRVWVRSAGRIRRGHRLRQSRYVGNWFSSFICHVQVNTGWTVQWKVLDEEEQVSSAGQQLHSNKSKVERVHYESIKVNYKTKTIFSQMCSLYLFCVYVNKSLHMCYFTFYFILLISMLKPVFRSSCRERKRLTPL